VMARRANPESGKKEKAPDPAVEAAKAERARAEAQAAADAGEAPKPKAADKVFSSKHGRIREASDEDMQDAVIELKSVPKSELTTKQGDRLARLEKELKQRRAAEKTVVPAKEKTTPTSTKAKKPSVAQSSATPVKGVDAQAKLDESRAQARAK